MRHRISPKGCQPSIHQLIVVLQRGADYSPPDPYLSKIAVRRDLVAVRKVEVGWGNKRSSHDTVEEADSVDAGNKNAPIDFPELTPIHHDKLTHGTIGYLEQAGVPVDYLQLADIGIRGNGHMMMFEENSDEIAEIILEWIEENVGPMEEALQP